MTIDIIFLIILIYGTIQGVRKGLFSEISTLAGIFLGILGAINFSEMVGKYLSEYINLEAKHISLISFGITFAGILVGIFMAGKIITRIFESMYLGSLNKLLGGIFGLLKFALILGVIITIFESFNTKTGIIENSKLEKSLMYNPLKKTALTVIPKIGKILGYN